MKKIYLKLLLAFISFSLNAQIYTEVEVQFSDEDPAWIPLNTLLAMRTIYNKE